MAVTGKNGEDSGGCGAETGRPARRAAPPGGSVGTCAETPYTRDEESAMWMRWRRREVQGPGELPAKGLPPLMRPPAPFRWAALPVGDHSPFPRGVLG